jgi:hypothetical protein
MLLENILPLQRMMFCIEQLEPASQKVHKELKAEKTTRMCSLLHWDRRWLFGPLEVSNYSDLLQLLLLGFHTASVYSAKTCGGRKKIINILACAPSHKYTRSTNVAASIKHTKSE